MSIVPYDTKFIKVGETNSAGRCEQDRPIRQSSVTF